MKVWTRVGDDGSYHCFDDVADATAYLNECDAGRVDHWVDAGPGVGIDTPNFHGLDFISLFWGDAMGNLICPLDKWERAAVEAGLVECFA